MLLVAIYLFSCFIVSSDQDELITKLSQENWDKTPLRSRQELLSQAKIIKMLQKQVDELEKNYRFKSLMQHVLKPDCRNDLK